MLLPTLDFFDWFAVFNQLLIAFVLDEIFLIQYCIAFVNVSATFLNCYEAFTKDYQTFLQVLYSQCPVGIPELDSFDPTTYFAGTW